MKELVGQILSSKTSVVVISIIAIALMLSGFESLHPHPHI